MSITTPIVKPPVPGTVIQFIGQAVPSIPPSAADTVGLTVIHDWGPDDTDLPGPLGLSGGPQLLTSFSQWTQIYGDSDTPGRTAVAGAFAGQNLPGFGGAGAVMVDRMVATDGAFGTLTITDVLTAHPVELTLTALYKGSRANQFSCITDSNPANAMQDRLRLLYGGAVSETYIYAQGDVTNLAISINTSSKMVSAAGAGTGSRLTPGTAAFVGGVDGSDVVAADHLTALGVLATQQFGILASYDLEDPATLASYVSWIDTQVAANRPVRLVIGGPNADNASSAITRSLSCNDWHVINFGVGTYHYDLLNKDLNTAQLAPLIAGILAACGQISSLTFCEIGGLHANAQSNPSASDVQSCIAGGVTCLQFANSPDADLRISKGVTTYTTTTDSHHPVAIFSDPRLVGIMDNYVAGMKSWGDSTIIGKLPVNDDTRDLVRGQARLMEDDLLRAGLILPGNSNIVPPVPAPWVVCEDPEDPTLRDAIPYTFGWRFAFTTDNILGQGTVQ